MRHVRQWLVNRPSLLSPNGVVIEIYELLHLQDQAILSEWAKHFREQYCLDSQIDIRRDGTGLTREEYLLQLVFPSRSGRPGPSIRSGDFSEVLVSDYAQFILGYWVPRNRFSTKTIPNESAKGSDVMGFKMIHATNPTVRDSLAIFESKAQLASYREDSVLQSAIIDSNKDIVRKSFSLNSTKQRLIDSGNFQEAALVARFQNPVDNPYEEISYAVAVVSSSLYDAALINQIDITAHGNRNNLKLLVIHGNDLMTLAHNLYQRSANEA